MQARTQARQRPQQRSRRLQVAPHGRAVDVQLAGGGRLLEDGRPVLREGLHLHVAVLREEGVAGRLRLPLLLPGPDLALLLRQPLPRHVDHAGEVAAVGGRLAVAHEQQPHRDAEQLRQEHPLARISPP